MAPSGERPDVSDTPFDVFISYRHTAEDRRWVRRMLVPELRAAGLRVLIDEESFRPGDTVVAEMSRGVVQSRFTVAVVTQSYAKSEFTQLERHLAEHLGREQAEQRLIIVIRDPDLAQEEADLPGHHPTLIMTNREEICLGIPTLIDMLRSRRTSTGGQTS